MYLNLFLMENIQGVLVAKQTHKYGLLNTKDSFELFNGVMGVFLNTEESRMQQRSFMTMDVLLICHDFKYDIAT